MTVLSKTPNLDRLVAYGRSARDAGTREIYSRFLRGLTEDGAAKVLADDYIRESIETFEQGQEEADAS